MNTQARVAIIGGGVMGCSLLYHLARLGWSDLVLLEKNELTAGSTWHAAGLCTHYAHNATVMQLRAESIRLYSGELERDTGLPVSFHATGALRVTASPDRMLEFRHIKGLGRFTGLDFNILTPDELKSVYPLVDTAGLVGAIHEPLDGYVDPSQATHAFAQGAKSRGAQIHRQTEVLSIDRVGQEWLLHTSNGDIRCEHVVNAAGTWCREIGLMMGVDLPVVPMLHQYIVTDRISAFADLAQELPFIRDPDQSWYLRQEGQGVIIGPYEKQGQAWAVDGVPAGFGMELLPPDLERIESIASAAMERIPAAAEGGIKTIVNGPITFTPDANPLIGPAFGLDHAWLLTGSSMGVMEGGGAGRFLAEWMDAGEPPADALAIDARRFGDYADRSYRLAKAIECFAAQFGIHYPYEERPAGRNKRLTAVHKQLDSLHAVFGSAYGWERPNYFARAGEPRVAELCFSRPSWFSRVADECEAVSSRAGIADLGVFSKFSVQGKDSSAFIAALGVNKAPAPGSVNLNLVLHRNGGVLLEFTVSCLTENHYLLMSASAAERIATDVLLQRAAHYRDLQISPWTNSHGLIAVMGPQAQTLLQGLTDADLGQPAFPWLGVQQINLAGHDLLALRVSYIGESGWELCLPAAHQAEVFSALLQAGKTVDIKPYGAFAMNAMRLEKGYRAWGLDYSTERTPLQAGMRKLVHTAQREFIGREAVLRREQQERWQMQLLALDAGPVDPFYLHPVMQGMDPIGLVTSAAYGHRVQQALALCYLRRPPDPQRSLEVEILGNRVGAQLLESPPYDPSHQRCRAG